MRTLVLAGVIVAISFGILEVALTAFAEDEGSRGAVGPLVTVWAIGSVVCGLAYGARTWASPPARRFLILTALLGLGAVPLPFAESLVAMAALLFVTGLALAPLGATEYARAAWGCWSRSPGGEAWPRRPTRLRPSRGAPARRPAWRASGAPPPRSGGCARA